MTESFVLKSSYNRRIFFTIAIGSIILIVLIQYFMLPNLGLNDVLQLKIFSVLDKLLTALISGTFLMAIISYLLPIETIRGQFKLIHPREVKVKLQEILLNSHDVVYSGHTGRWTRSKTIPYLASEARDNNQVKNIDVIIINPNNVSICEKYSNYRSGLSSSASANLNDVQSVRIQLLATIMNSINWSIKEPLLNISIQLTDNFTVFRYDKTEKGIVITTEDRRSPSIFCDKGSMQFSNYKNDIELSKRHSHSIDYSMISSLIEDVKDDITQVKQYFNSINIGVDDFSDDELSEVCSIASKPVNPYLE